MQIQYNILLPLKYMIEEQKCILRIESYLYTYKKENVNSKATQLKSVGQSLSHIIVFTRSVSKK